MTDPSPTGYGPHDCPARIAERWVAAWNAHDADRLARLFDAEAEFVNVTGLWWHSRDAIRRAHAYGFETIFSHSTISVLDTSTRWLAGSPEDTVRAVAVVHAKMKLEGQTAVGETQQPGIRRTIFSFVVRREAETWHCVSAHNTDIVPGSETNVVGPDGRLRPVSYRGDVDEGM